MGFGQFNSLHAVADASSDIQDMAADSFRQAYGVGLDQMATSATELQQLSSLKNISDSLIGNSQK